MATEGVQSSDVGDFIFYFSRSLALSLSRSLALSLSRSLDLSLSRSLALLFFSFSLHDKLIIAADGSEGDVRHAIFYDSTTCVRVRACRKIQVASYRKIHRRILVAS